MTLHSRNRIIQQLRQTRYQLHMIHLLKLRLQVITHQPHSMQSRIPNLRIRISEKLDTELDNRFRLLNLFVILPKLGAGKYPCKPKPPVLKFAQETHLLHDYLHQQLFIYAGKKSVKVAECTVLYRKLFVCLVQLVYTEPCFY